MSTVRYENKITEVSWTWRLSISLCDHSPKHVPDAELIQVSHYWLEQCPS